MRAAISPTPKPCLALRLVLAPRTFAPHRASPHLTCHRASPATAHLAPRTWHRLAWHRASPCTGTNTAPRVAPRSNHDVEDIYRHWDALVDRSDLPALNEIVTDLVADTPRTERGLEQALPR